MNRRRSVLLIKAVTVLGQVKSGVRSIAILAAFPLGNRGVKAVIVLYAGVLDVRDRGFLLLA